jgi:hypothetical protein
LDDQRPPSLRLILTEVELKDTYLHKGSHSRKLDFSAESLDYTAAIAGLQTQPVAYRTPLSEINIILSSVFIGSL